MEKRGRGQGKARRGEEAERNGKRGKARLEVQSRYERPNSTVMPTDVYAETTELTLVVLVRFSCGYLNKTPSITAPLAANARE